MRKSNLIYLAIITALLVFILLNKSCDQDKSVQFVTDTLTTANTIHATQITKLDSSVKARDPRFKTDSLKLVKQIRDLKAKYLQALSASPDTCRPQIHIIYNEAIRIDSTAKTTIARRDSTIEEQAHQIGLYRLVVRNDTIRMAQLSDSLKAEKKSRKKYWRGFKHGAIAGAVLVEGVNIGAKFLK